MASWRARITNNRYFYHYLFWGIVFLSYFVDAAELRQFDAHLFLHTLVLKNGLLIGIVYLHLRILIPAFLNSGRYGWYAFSLSLTICCGTWLINRIEFNSWKKIYVLEMVHHPGVDPVNMAPPLPQIEVPNTSLPEGRYLLDALTVCRYLVISLLLKFIDDFFRQRDQLQQAVYEKTMAELNVLKTQINPHFLFNTLNNLYGLVLERSEHAAETVLKLADIMKYTLAEGDAQEVPLKKDLENLRHYFDLELLRLPDGSGLSFSSTGAQEHHRIAPLLLLPLLENGFKHGVHRRQTKPVLNLEINVEGDVLHFKTINLMPEDQAPPSLGMGLNNVKKRLELLYPGRYRFEIQEEQGYFMVQLDLQLKQNTQHLFENSGEGV